MMSDHAFLPPSGAKAWSVCALWPTMNKLYPQGDTEASLEGTAAHEVFMAIAQGHRPAENSLTPNGQVVTKEMLDGADLFLDAIQQRIAIHGPQHAVGAMEQRVAIPRVHAFNWGTPDYWFYLPQSKVLEVVDYKFGHEFVDEFENVQVVDYAIGVIDYLANGEGVLPIDFEFGLKQINFTIVQPRCYYRNRPVRTWSTNAFGIKHIRELLIAQAAAAFDPAPKAVPNPECKHCPGSHACPALQKAAYADADLSLRTLPHDLPTEVMSLEAKMLRKALERLTARVEGLEEVLLTKLRQGGKAPFHGLEHPHGRVRWKISDEEVLALGQMFKVDVSKVDVVTPNQAIDRGLSEVLVKQYSDAPIGKAKLVPVDASDARRVFGFRN